MTTATEPAQQPVAATPGPPATTPAPVVVQATTEQSGGNGATATPNRAERRAAEKAARKQAPTLSQLRAKKPRKGEIPITLLDENGLPEEYVFQAQAIGSKLYDKLVAAHPPTNKQRDQNQVYNIDTFAPALIAAVITDPKMTAEEVAELYDSDDWAPGEMGNLFFSCQRLCNMGIDVPFNGGV